MKVLVHAEGSSALEQLAQKICEGIAKTGNSFSRGWPCECDAAFFGTEFAGRQQQGILEIGGALKGKPAAVFCIQADGREKLEKLVAVLAGAGMRVHETLSIKQLRGFFGAKPLSEADLARASAFGEKTLNRWRGKRVTQPSEKTR
ncbi:MAG: hypothetical protein AB1626_03225, partial [Candidatus Micrarchaeota archaeon]